MLAMFCDLKKCKMIMKSANAKLQFKTQFDLKNVICQPILKRIFSAFLQLKRSLSLEYLVKFNFTFFLW